MPAVFMPRTLDELLELKAADPSLAVFAGGTDLMLLMRHNRSRPSALACLDRVEELGQITDTGPDIAIGARVTHSCLLASFLVQRHFPVLIQALSTLGSPHIRNMGTLGGNIVTASPAGDTLPPLYVLGAQVELVSTRGTVRMPIADFISGPGITCLGPGQILHRVLLPKSPEFAVHYFEKVGLRKSLSIAVVSMAALVDPDPAGTVRDVRMAWGSVGRTIFTCPEAEEILRGYPPTRERLEAAAACVRSGVAPISDVRATADYRRRVAGNLVLRLAGACRISAQGDGR